MITSSLILQAVISGILQGGVYAVVAVGLGLVWGVMKILNIAHAALVILGAYLVITMMQSFGMDPVVSLVVSIPVMFLLGALLQQYVVRPLSDRRDFQSHTFLILYGVMLIVENMSVFFWTTDVRLINPPYAQQTLSAGGFLFPTSPLIAFAIAVVAILVVYLFITRSRLGLAVQAIGFDREAASLVGISVNRASMIAFGLGTATAAVAGLALGLVSSFYPGVQLIWVGKAFLIVVLGGVDNIPGIFLAAMILGVLEALVGVTLPSYLVDFVAYVLLIFVLMVRPQGLLGRRTNPA